MKIVFLGGSPYEQGLFHGEILRSEIEGMIENYVVLGDETIGVPQDVLLGESRRSEPYLTEEEKEELRGIADSSQLDYRLLLALNYLPDVDGAYEQRLLQCCNFVSIDNQNRLIHGRNMDFPPTRDGALQAASSLFCRPASPWASATVLVGVAGFIGGFTGLSSKRIMISHVAVPTMSATSLGTPIHLQIRHLLESAGSCRDVHSLLCSIRRTCGYNLAVSDSNCCDAIAIEMTKNLCEYRKSSNGILIVDNVCFCKKTANRRVIFPAGAFRYARLMQLLSSRQKLMETSDALKILQDHFDLAASSESLYTYNAICNHHTVHSVVYSSYCNTLSVSVESVPAPLGRYHQIELPLLWSKLTSTVSSNDSCILAL